MAWFSRTKSNEADIPWQVLSQRQDLDNIDLASNDKLQVIFKHSTRCGISSMAMSRLKREYKVNLEADWHYLDLLSYRAVSNEIAERYGVFHESPQLLVISKGMSVTHGSHNQVGVHLIEDALNS